MIMIPIEKLTYEHLGRRVIDSDKDIGEIYSFNKDQIEVVYSGGRSYLFDPEDLEFYDFPGGLTRKDIGSHWKDNYGDRCTFIGSGFSDISNTEHLIFNYEDVDLELRHTSKQFKSFTRINKILQDENNAQ